MMMNVQKVINFLISQKIFFLFLGCAVEVGNPHSGKPPKGALTVTLGDSPSRIAKELVVKIKRIEVRTEDYRHNFDADKEINVISSQDPNNLIVISEQGLPAGDYRSILIHLDAREPAYLRLADSSKIPLPLGGYDPIIRFQSPFKVQDGQSTKLTVDLQVQRSLKVVQTTDGTGNTSTQYVLDPVGSVTPDDVVGSIRGEVDFDDATAICAYLYEALPVAPLQLRSEYFHSPEREEPQSNAFGLFKLDDDDDDDDESDDDEKPLDADPAPIYENKDSIVKDDNASCSGATAVAVVEEEKFHLRNLLPGKYDLRVFNSEEFKDVATGVVVVSGDQLILDL